METEQLNAIAQLIIQGMVSAVFIWAWGQERKERQDREKAHSAERVEWLREYTSLAREAYQLKPSDVREISRIDGAGEKV